MASIFTKIISKEIPAFIVFEDEFTLAFLDIHPLEKGHVLIVPKVEIDKFYEVPEPYYTAVFQTAKFLAPVLEKTFGCERVVAKIIGTDVPHFHLHLIPREDVYTGKPIKLNSEQMTEIQARILQGMKVT